MGDRQRRSARAPSRRRRARASASGPAGCVEMISSSGRNVRSASSIAWIGSPSPISPVASMPAARIDARLASSRSCAGRARVVLVGDPVPERRVERRADDEHARVAAAGALADLATGAPGRRPSRSRPRGSGARSGGLRRRRLPHRRLRARRAQKSHQSDAGGQHDEDGDAEPDVDQRRRSRSARSSRSSARRTGTRLPRSGRGSASAR